MDINEFASYCMDNASNIYIVEFGKVMNLAKARDKTFQMHKLWRGRFVNNAPSSGGRHKTGTIKGSTPAGSILMGPPSGRESRIGILKE